jgi:plasmid stabilization system protein ParE
VAKLLVTPGAARGLERCRAHLAARSPAAARRAAEAIAGHLERLTTTPAMGRPVADTPGFRELIIPFGDSGYVALYRHEEQRDLVLLLAFRHQREAGYG